MVGAPDGTATPTWEAPKPYPAPLAYGDGLGPPPSRRGWGLIVSGAALSGLLVTVRDGVLATGVVFAGFDGDSSFGQFLVSVTGSLDLLVVLSGSLVAGGAYRKGRFDARHTPFALDEADLRRRARAGWAWFGVGAALLAGQIGVAYGLASVPFGEFRRREGLYWSHFVLSFAGTAALAVGLSKGPYTAGLLEGAGERRQPSVMLAPTPVRGGGGVAVAGRF